MKKIGRGRINARLLSMLLLMAAILVLFTVWTALRGRQFLTLNTIISIGDLMIVTSFLAVGAGMLLVSGNLDFSASAIGAFSCVLFAVCLKYLGMPIWAAALAALAGGTAFGIINGVLVNEFGFQPYIATMAMSFVIKGAMQLVSRNPDTGIPQAVNYSSAATKFIGTYKLWGVIPIALIPAIAVFIIYGVILSRTRFGRQIYLVGGNPQSARLTGTSPKKVTYILFANSGFLAAVAGIIYMCRASQGDLNALQLNQFTGFTAAMLGGISFGGGTGTMAGVFVGLMILNTFSYGTVSVHLSNYWTTILTGILLLIALSMDTSFKSSLRRPRKNKKAARQTLEGGENENAT